MPEESSRATHCPSWDWVDWVSGGILVVGMLFTGALIAAAWWNSGLPTGSSPIGIFLGLTQIAFTIGWFVVAVKLLMVGIEI